MMRLFCITMMILLVGGCSQWSYGRHTTPAVVEDRTGDTILWLAAYRNIREMTPEQLEQKLVYDEEAYLKNQDAETSLRLALLLATAEPPVQDRQRARELLDEFNPEQATGTEVSIAMLLQQMLNEQLNREEREKALRNRLANGDRRITELENQLDALTSIEQSINKREQGSEE